MLSLTNPGPDYTLRWPRELFAAEATALAAGEPLLMKSAWTGQVETLLEEAFGSVVPVTDFRQSDLKATWSNEDAGGLGRLLPHLRSPTAFLRALIDVVPRLPETRRPKWSRSIVRQGLSR